MNKSNIKFKLQKFNILPYNKNTCYIVIAYQYIIMKLK